MLNEATQFAIAAWLATYLLHSTVLLAALWALCGLLHRRQEALLEMLWRFALVAPLLSASLQTGLSVDPLAGALPVADRAGFRAAAANDPAAWLEAPAMTEGTHDGGARPAIAINEGGDLHPDRDHDRPPSADHPAAAATDDAYGQQAGARDNDGPRPTRSGIAILRSAPE